MQQSQDSLARFDEFTSGLLLTGFHRTAAELANRKQLAETVGGGNLEYSSREGEFSAGMTAVNTHYDTPLLRRPEPHNRYEFSGRDNLSLGLHYSYAWRNLLLFGETARSRSGGLGTVNGLLASLATNVDAAVHVRHFAPDFHTLYGLALSENTRNINESGLYLGLKLRPVAKWELSAYYDQFRFPWLRYQSGAPSRGHDALLRLAYSPSKTSLLYVQLRQREKAFDLPGDPARPLPLPAPQLRRSLLLYYNTNPTPALEFRTRLQASQLRDDARLPWRRGYVLAQDVSVQPNRSVKVSARYALFDADDFDTRQFVFEQDILYAVSIPALYGQGTRVYVLTQISLNRHLTLWLRYADTRYRNQTTVGSGLEEIQGRARSEVKGQVRYKF